MKEETLNRRIEFSKHKDITIAKIKVVKHEPMFNTTGSFFYKNEWYPEDAIIIWDKQ